MTSSPTSCSRTEGLIQVFIGFPPLARAARTSRAACADLIGNRRDHDQSYFPLSAIKATDATLLRMAPPAPRRGKRDARASRSSSFARARTAIDPLGRSPALPSRVENRRGGRSGRRAGNQCCRRSASDDVDLGRQIARDLEADFLLANRRLAPALHGESSLELPRADRRPVWNAANVAKRFDNFKSQVRDHIIRSTYHHA